MKKSSLFLAVVYSLPLVCFSAEENKTSSPKKIYGNHIYFGPEIFLFDLNTHVRNVKVHGLKIFGGLRLRYEYLKPKAIYAGIDLFSAVSNKSFNASIKEFHFPHNNKVTGFSNFELRLGYTAGIKKWSLTPFFGLGGYSFANNGHSFHFRETMLYYAAGLRSLFDLSDSFYLGANLKVFRTDDTERKFTFRFGGHIKHLKNSDNMWGGEIGVPLVWHVGSRRRWDIQLEPYFLKLDFSEVQNIYGTRLLFGYSF